MSGPAINQDGLDALEAALAGRLRHDIVAAASRLQPLSRALGEIRRAMQTHVWRGGGETVDLRAWVDALDQRTPRKAFTSCTIGRQSRSRHAQSHRRRRAQFLGRRGPEPSDPQALAILVDYYFVYLLALAAMRAWDEPDPPAVLDRITSLLEQLQGPAGSGHKFADNAETLILIATSHYEPNEEGYATLLDRARALPRRTRTAMALGHAQAMGGHLRFG